jgi:hypothetical protein
MSLEWEQSYVLMLKRGFLVPLNLDERPNPAEWTWTERAKRGVNDYVSTAASPTRLHHFSPSTKTWYSTDRPPYIPQTLDIEPRKVKSTREKAPEPIQINESVESPVAFSSIETFFQ